MSGPVPRILFLVLFLGIAVFYYFFFGPGPTLQDLSGGLPWWRPRGWALRWHSFAGLAGMARSGWPSILLPILIFCIPPVTLTGVGFALFRSALLRTVLLALGLSLCFFVVYGYIAEGAIWRFFSWRFLATALSLGSIVAVLALAPSLLRGVLTLPRAWAITLLLAVFACIFLLSTEITGTNPGLRANLSPWPTLTLFGFLFSGYCLATLHAAAGLGLWLRSRWPGVLGVTLAALLAGGLGLLIFEGSGLLGPAVLGLLGALYARLASKLPNGAALHVGAAALIASFIFVSHRSALSFLDVARNERSAEVIAALDAYRQVHTSYPDALQDLLPEFLVEVPPARVGLIRHAGEEFVYSNFGDSYALEFASVLWVQCAYSPPYVFDEEDEMDAAEEPDVAAGGDPLSTEEEEERALAGSWSCESTPPTLW